MKTTQKTRLTEGERHIITMYYYSKATRLDQVYKNYSVYKTRAEYFILKEMEENSGEDYRIIGHNCNTFSCGYRYKDNEGKEWLRYHTRSNAYNIPIYLY